METTYKPFSLTKTFNAPKKAVFAAFANEEALAEWWGPVEAPIDVIKLDFRRGGIFHYKMKGNFNEYGIFRYREIIEPDSITWVNSFADENAQIIKPPFKGIDIPSEILNKITLEEKNGVTTLTLTAKPINASDKEVHDFYAITESMENGLGGTFNQLEKYLNNVPVNR